MIRRRGTVCFFLRPGQVLLAQFRYPDGQILWSGIGGMVDVGEDPLQAVLREIGEETLLEVGPDDLQEVLSLDIGDLHMHVFFCHAWQGQEVAIDPTIKQMRWWDQEALPWERMHPGNQQWLEGLLG